MVHLAVIAVHRYRQPVFVAMSFVIANNFIRKRGKERLRRFLELCNKANLRELAEYLGVSEQRASVLRDQLFDKVWVYKDTTIEAIEFERHVNESALQDLEEMVESNKAKNRKIHNVLYLNGHHRA